LAPQCTLLPYTTLFRSTFAMDRAGIVGADGPTHHGLLDIAYLRGYPHIVLMAPKDEAELRDMLYTAIEHKGPAALRYPRGNGLRSEEHTSELQSREKLV